MGKCFQSPNEILLREVSDSSSCMNNKVCLIFDQTTATRIQIQHRYCKLQNTSYETRFGRNQTMKPITKLGINPPRIEMSTIMSHQPLAHLCLYYDQNHHKCFERARPSSNREHTQIPWVGLPRSQHSDNKYCKICNTIGGSNILFQLLEIIEEAGWWTHGLVQLDLL